jgi:hypothetical protein
MIKKISGIHDGLLLLLAGAFMGWFVVSGEYWRLMHPKFQWLTAFAAFLLLLLGAVGLGYGRRALKPTRSLIVFGMIGFGLIAGSASTTFLSVKGLSPPDQESRISLDGFDYIKINIGEIFFLLQGFSLDRNKEPEAIKHRYVMRGVVKHHPDLERMGQFMLMRAVIWCCLADATGTGLRVRFDQPHTLKEGHWVQVFGRFEKMTDKPPPVFLRFDKTLVTWIEQNHILVPDKIVRISSPELPYIFDRRTEEPFNY